MSALVVLAFSGGLDTCWCVRTLREQGYDVVTATVDVGGFSEQEIERLAETSSTLGAKAHHHIDARRAFYDEVVRFLVMGNVRKGDVYPLCVGSERGLQAAKVASLALDLEAKAVAHGCTAAGNDQVRFEIALAATAPSLDILAPVRDLAPMRDDQIETLTSCGLPLPAGGGRFSINSGMWGITIGGQETLTSHGPIPEEAWVRTKGAFEADPPPRTLRLAFERGEAVALDGRRLAPVALIESLDAVAAGFGLGRGIHLGETLLGTKGRVAFEAPAATVLLQAHRELEKLVLTGTQLQAKEMLSPLYAELVHGGRHRDPAARDIEALLLSSQQSVTGNVEVLLRTGSSFVTGVTSPHSLMEASRSTYGEVAGDWTPADARGFSRITGLPTILHARAGEEG